MIALPLAAGEGFVPPGPKDFELPPIFDSVGWFTKPILIGVLTAIVIAVFFVTVSRRPQLVPGRLQFAGETAYNFVRNTIARDSIGHDYLRYVPYLAALFYFILLNNVGASIPFVQFPTFSHVGWAYAAAVLSWVIYNAAGIWHKGPHQANPVVRVLAGIPRYLKHQTVPAGVPGALLPLLVPIEFISNILVRPVSLSLRLFANMFAGHILLLVFVVGGEYLVLGSGSLPLAGAGIVTWIMGLAIAGLELFVQVIQAFIFAVLSAQYIGGAIGEEH